MDCIFCKIVAEQIPSKKVYEDEQILAFYDINPAVPVHVLVIPKIHMDSLNDINQSNVGVVSYVLEQIPQIAETLGIIDGYRVITNVGEKAGQTVKHLHFHVLGKMRDVRL